MADPRQPTGGKPAQRFIDRLTPRVAAQLLGEHQDVFGGMAAPCAMFGVAACQASPISTTLPATGSSTHAVSTALNWTAASSLT